MPRPILPHGPGAKTHALKNGNTMEILHISIRSHSRGSNPIPSMPIAWAVAISGVPGINFARPQPNLMNSPSSTLAMHKTTCSLCGHAPSEPPYSTRPMPILSSTQATSSIAPTGTVNGRNGLNLATGSMQKSPAYLRRGITNTIKMETNAIYLFYGVRISPCQKMVPKALRKRPITQTIRVRASSRSIPMNVTKNRHPGWNKYSKITRINGPLSHSITPSIRRLKVATIKTCAKRGNPSLTNTPSIWCSRVTTTRMPEEITSAAAQPCATQPKAQFMSYPSAVPNNTNSEKIAG